MVWRYCSAAEALSRVFVTLDEGFRRSDDLIWQRRAAAVGVAGAGQRKRPGCTAIAAVIWGSTLVLANAGTTFLQSNKSGLQCHCGCDLGQYT